MNKLFLTSLLCVCFQLGCISEKGDLSQAKSDSATLVTDQVVDATCGQCQWGMTGGGCDLGVKFEGATYFVDGSSIDDHGDAHGEDGLCNCVRKATVAGKVEDGRFVASSFNVLPNESQRD